MAAAMMPTAVRNRIAGSGLGSAGHVVAAVLLGLPLFVALLVTARRLSGAFSQPPHLMAVLMITALWVLAAVVARHMAVFHFRRQRLWRVLGWSPAASLLVLTVALSLPNTDTLTLVVMWGAASGIAAWSGLGIFKQWRLSTDPVDRHHGMTSEGDASRGDLTSFAEIAADERLDQHWLRVRTTDGSACIRGLLRAELLAGQRTAQLHLVFCPPFSARPILECEQTAGPEARIKAAQVLPHGARLEIKLSSPAILPTEVLVEFVAIERG